MTPVERMNAAMNLRPTDRVPNAPFYEAPVCTYFGGSFREALLGGRTMADAHLEALETFRFDWVILGMGLIGDIIPEALGCRVEYPENDFPIIRETVVRSEEDLERLAESRIQNRRMDVFLDGVSHRHPPQGTDRNHERHDQATGTAGPTAGHLSQTGHRVGTAALGSGSRVYLLRGRHGVPAPDFPTPLPAPGPRAHQTGRQ